MLWHYFAMLWILSLSLWSVLATIGSAGDSCDSSFLQLKAIHGDSHLESSIWLHALEIYPRNFMGKKEKENQATNRKKLNFSESPYILRFHAEKLEGTDAHADLPVVIMHGMGDYGSNPNGMVPLQELVAHIAKTYVHNVELCSSADMLSDCAEDDQDNGFFMTMDQQVDQFARVVRADPKLNRGFNALGFSQGNMVIRGYIHKYNNPPVKSFISMHGVLMGVNGVPDCPMTSGLCRFVTMVISHAGIYSGYVQDQLAQANYFRDAGNLETYRSSCHFLPFINNEAKDGQNPAYKENFQTLSKLVLVMAEEDTMVHPKESEHFGYFKDGSRNELVAMRDAPWYQEDWFGLKTLDEAKKIDFYTTPGDHLQFTKEFLQDLVLRYFTSPP